MAWPKGKKHSDETKNKMSETRKGRKRPTFSEEWKRNLSEAHKGHSSPMKGKKHSEESRKKMSESKKGKPSSRKGCILSEETKMKISEANKNRTTETKQRISEAARFRAINQKPQYRSKGEKELVSFIKTIYNGEVLENDRKLLNGFELDVYLPELKLAFEYNGDYWHSLPERRERDVHKIIMCHAKGVELFHVWESDWKHQNQETKNLIAMTIRGV